jgi:hypothetical protein
MGQKKIKTPLALESKKLNEKERNIRRRRGRLADLEGDKDQIVRGVCLKKFASISQGKSQESRKAASFADKYVAKLSEYKGTRRYNWRRYSKEGKFSLILCSRAAAQADTIGASIDDYIESQFYWFDFYFQRPPRLPELASVKSIERFYEWKKLSSSRQIVGKVKHYSQLIKKISTKKATPEESFEYELSVLERMIIQWGGEDVVWTLCGDIGDTDIFTDEFKRTRAVWRSMYEKEC